MAHSQPVARLRFVAAALGAATVLAGCGSARTELPERVAPPRFPPTPAAPSDGGQTVDSGTASTSSTAPATTASAYKSPGEKHPLPGGTLAASNPRVGVRVPRGAAPAPQGQAWAVLNVRFCASEDASIPEHLVDPARFKVEVPGQGYVAPAPDAPALAPAPLQTGSTVAFGACTEGSIAYLVAGEGHIESITYDSGEGLLRWAT